MTRIKIIGGALSEIGNNYSAVIEANGDAYIEDISMRYSTGNYEVLQPLFTEPFTNKYYVCSNTMSTPDTCWSTENDNEETIPQVFDTKADAIKAIAGHIEDVADSVKNGDMDESCLDELLDECFVADCDYENGILHIYNVDDYGNIDSYFQGTLDEFREQL
jgi:hypothetical protein